MGGGAPRPNYWGQGPEFFVQNTDMQRFYMGFNNNLCSKLS